VDYIVTEYKAESTTIIFHNERLLSVITRYSTYSWNAKIILYNFFIRKKGHASDKWQYIVRLCEGITLLAILSKDWSNRNVKIIQSFSFVHSCREISRSIIGGGSENYWSWVKRHESDLESTCVPEMEHFCGSPQRARRDGLPRDDPGASSLHGWHVIRLRGCEPRWFARFARDLTQAPCRGDVFCP